MPRPGCGGTLPALGEKGLNERQGLRGNGIGFDCGRRSQGVPGGPLRRPGPGPERFHVGAREGNAVGANGDRRKHAGGHVALYRVDSDAERFGRLRLAQQLRFRQRGVVGVRRSSPPAGRRWLRPCEPCWRSGVRLSSRKAARVAFCRHSRVRLSRRGLDAPEPPPRQLGAHPSLGVASLIGSCSDDGWRLRPDAQHGRHVFEREPAVAAGV